MRKKECAFCPSQATATGEHLWSDWINRVFPERRYFFRRVDADRLKVKEWETDSLKATARVACGSCNQGWMSVVDAEEARPSMAPLIVELSPRVLRRPTLISIGIFAFKTAVVADCMMTGGTPFFTREGRHAFGRSRTIPGGVFMWLGAIGTDRAGVFKSRHIVSALPVPNSFHVYVFTYAVGHLLLQVVGARWQRPENHQFFPILDQPSEHDDFLCSFWPPPGAINWPPSERIRESSIDEIVDRWSRILTTYTG